MTSAVAEPDGSLIGDYRSRLASGPNAAHDELAGPDGVLEHQRPVAEAIRTLGLRGLRTAQADVRRFVRDDGIRFGTSGSGNGARRWEIDPLPVVLTAREWDGLEAGLVQRARLLDLLLRDLYGPQRLLRAGVVPAELVYGHPGFVHQASGIADPRSRLVLTAVDLGRAADGGWRVIADRNETPAGAGYAMASRRITTRVMAALHRDTDLVRLRGFFHTMTLALQDVAAGVSAPPRIVLLSAGAVSDTAFEQAFIATLCGFPVVEAEDLVMRDGRVWIRTSARPEPVDVILRRVDSGLADPLELRADSEVGVPGLIEAVRRGRVMVANPVGAGLLDNPGLLPYLPAVARALLDEDLRLASAQTWWCGDASSREYVLAHLHQLVLKPIGSSERARSRFGWLLGQRELAELRRQVESSPWGWCGQEPLPLSTAPVVTPGGLEPRRLVLRTFAATAQGRAHLMPGGLARVAARADHPHVSSGSGALAKDVWVLAAPETARSGPAERPVEQHARLARRTTPAPRVAEHLYVVGRTAERVESTARLLRLTADLAEDHASRPATPGAAAMEALLSTVGVITGVDRVPPDQPAGAALITHLRRLVVEVETPGTVAYAASRLAEAAQQVRDQLSGDAWIVLSRLERTLGETPPDDAHLQSQLARVLESMLAMAGIIVESMVRDPAWGFIDAGSRIERSGYTLTLLRHTIAQARSPVIDGQVAEAVLTAGESIITHRRRTVTGEGPASPVHSAVTLLLLDPGNPRSVAFQVRRLTEDVRLIGDERLAERADRITATLADLDVERLCAGRRTALAQAVDSLAGEIDALDAAMARAHFSRRPPQRVLRTQRATAHR